MISTRSEVNSADATSVLPRGISSQDSSVSISEHTRTALSPRKDLLLKASPWRETDARRKSNIGQRLKKRVALFRITQFRRVGNKAAWGHSPDVPVWRDGDHTTERGGPCSPSKRPDAWSKKPFSERSVESTRVTASLNSDMAVFSSPLPFYPLVAHLPGPPSRLAANRGACRMSCTTRGICHVYDASDSIAQQEGTQASAHGSAGDPTSRSLGLPNFQMVVTDEHVKALERAQVAFTYLSKTC